MEMAMPAVWVGCICDQSCVENAKCVHPSRVRVVKFYRYSTPYCAIAADYKVSYQF